KEPFYEIESLIKATNGSFKALLSPSQRFSTKEELLSFVSSKGAAIGTQPGTIKDLQTKMKKTNSPNLFSL
ncbi:DNA topoisomerase, partial [Enterococcus casseliflavus]|nr:DNA topoisomerase [Enterococcus casseliflavus]